MKTLMIVLAGGLIGASAAAHAEVVGVEKSVKTTDVAAEVRAVLHLSSPSCPIGGGSGIHPSSASGSGGSSQGSLQGSTRRR